MERYWEAQKQSVEEALKHGAYLKDREFIARCPTAVPFAADCAVSDTGGALWQSFNMFRNSGIGGMIWY